MENILYCERLCKWSGTLLKNASKRVKQPYRKRCRRHHGGGRTLWDFIKTLAKAKQFLKIFFFRIAVNFIFISCNIVKIKKTPIKVPLEKSHLYNILS